MLATSTQLVVHYDPVDISVLHVKLPAGEYLKVGYADLRHPAIALWECLATQKYLRTVSRSAINESRLFEAINVQRKIIDDAKNETRRARKNAARKGAERRSRAIDPHTNNAAQKQPSTEIGYSIDAPDYPVEMW